MNYNDPKDKEFIEKLVQEYIEIQDQKSGSQFSKEYTKEELRIRFEKLRNQLIKEIKRTAQQFKKRTNKELTIYNCFNNLEYKFLFNKITKINWHLKEIEENQTKKNLKNHQHLYLSLIIQTLNYILPESNLGEYYPNDHRAEGQRIPTVEELLKGTYDNKKEFEIALNKKEELDRKKIECQEYHQIEETFKS